MKLLILRFTLNYILFGLKMDYGNRWSKLVLIVYLNPISMQPCLLEPVFTQIQHQYNMAHFKLYEELVNNYGLVVAF